MSDEVSQPDEKNDGSESNVDPNPDADQQTASVDDWMAGFSDDSNDYSLDELSQAYAQILADQDDADLPDQADEQDAGDPPHRDVVDKANVVDEQGQRDDLESSASLGTHLASEPAHHRAILDRVDTEGVNLDLDGDDRVTITPERIVESILFVGTSDNSPISGRLLASLMRGVSPEEVDQYIDKLNIGYQEDESAYAVLKEPLGYRMILGDAYHPIRNRFYGQVREAKLSQTIIDTLSIVAYHQPVTKKEVDAIVGQSCSSNLNQLLRRNLLCLETQTDKTKVYNTTDRFLELFGIESLDDLPQSEAMDES